MVEQYGVMSSVSAVNMYLFIILISRRKANDYTEKLKSSIILPGEVILHMTFHYRFSLQV